MVVIVGQAGLVVEDFGVNDFPDEYSMSADVQVAGYPGFQIRGGIIRDHRAFVLPVM